MRCPNCQKFVSLEMQEPEVSDLNVTYTGDVAYAKTFSITGSVRIVRTCADCGQELKDATLDIEHDGALGENVSHTPEDLKRWVEKDLSDATVEADDVSSIEESGGRYAKSFFGARVAMNIRLGDETVASVAWSDKIAASAMDEMV
jgi:hypothetical protein